MRITIRLPDTLLLAAKREAAKCGTAGCFRESIWIDSASLLDAMDGVE